jgi:hypothetical protein
MNIQYLSVRDAMLLYAECLANDGELSAAMDLVNQVRTRAAREENTVAVANNGYEYKEKGETKESDPIVINYKIATYPATHAAFSNKETCIKAVRMERKLELAMEGQRFFDLSRWGGDYMAAELAAYVDYEKKHLSKFAGAAYLPASKTMFPVPQNQIDLMGNDESGQPYLVQPDPWK